MKKSRRKQHKKHPSITRRKKEDFVTEQSVKRHFSALINQLRKSRDSCEIQQIKAELARMTFGS